MARNRITFGKILTTIGGAVALFLLGTIESRAATADPAVLRETMPKKIFDEMISGNHLVGHPGLVWERPTVTVAFSGGSQPIYQLIEQTAAEWTALGGKLKFSFRDPQSGQYRQWSSTDKRPKADIRISFDNTGYWSAIGQTALNIRPGEATLNLDGYDAALSNYVGDPNRKTWMASYEHFIILHEFGHAVGLSHEHFHPECQADLDKDGYENYLTGSPNNWTLDQAKYNIDSTVYFAELKVQPGGVSSVPIFSQHTDQLSTMLYPIPVKYLKSGVNSPCLAKGPKGHAVAISAGEKSFYVKSYARMRSPF